MPGEGDEQESGERTHPATDEQPVKVSATRGTLSLVVAVMFGVLGGLGAFTFGYGEGASYLSNDPNACANCHIMQDQLNTWVKSSHHHVATCNDCHLPHDPIGKWITKMDNGFFHSLAFTTGDFHEPIQIKPRNAEVTQQACLYCHSKLVNHMLPTKDGDQTARCVHCHQSVGHAQR
ncbi:Cytochrome c-type protein NrfH [Planctomycetes bacterium Pan216]|uniref:Cytochrome c-type protein NrfH n=1 Tax=Kolteria novifilia TaxID=2527975 RepID=A0A518B6W2_9BACT|nr:Cytochrome c-type protein NrfH [Planctomycetes bacterium Pan216]